MEGQPASTTHTQAGGASRHRHCHCCSAARLALNSVTVVPSKAISRRRRAACSRAHEAQGHGHGPPVAALDENGMRSSKLAVRTGSAVPPAPPTWMAGYSSAPRPMVPKVNRMTGTSPYTCNSRIVISALCKLLLQQLIRWQHWQHV